MLNDTQQARPAGLFGGPIWFRKMDRNLGNRLSRREFLGMIEGFDRYDRNGDDLIDAMEAKSVAQGGLP